MGRQLDFQKNRISVSERRILWQLPHKVNSVVNAVEVVAPSLHSSFFFKMSQNGVFKKILRNLQKYHSTASIFTSASLGLPTAIPLELRRVTCIQFVLRGERNFIFNLQFWHEKLM